jgi:hypothetical protein
MKLKWIIPLWIVLTGFTASAQTLIGLPKEEVSRRISMYHKEFRKDNMVVKQHFNYLKYVNGIRTKTWILYFNDRDVCHLSKLICDYSEYDRVLESLNETYTKTGESAWEYERSGQLHTVRLTKQEYYFIVREESGKR